jgi:hypothetical protein
MFRKPSSQSQSISGTQITGAQVQQGQAGQVLAQNQTGNLSAHQQGLSGTEVLRLLEDLEVAKDEAEEKNANKDLIAQNLKKVSEALETVNKATDTGKSLWQKGQEVFKAIAPWLGSAAKLLGF